MVLHFLKFEGIMFIGHPGFAVAVFFSGQNSSKLFFFFLMTQPSNEIKSPESSNAEQTRHTAKPFVCWLFHDWILKIPPRKVTSR